MISFRSKGLPLLNVLSDAELGELMKNAHVRNHGKNGMLFSAGSAREHVYFVMSGWVGLFADSADGGQAVVDIITTGAMVGEHLIHSPEEDELYAMVISHEASILEIALHDVQQFAKTNPAFAYELFRFMSCQSLQMRKQICHTNCMSAVDRILVFLLRFAEPGRPQFLLPFNRTLMAAYLGMKRETFSRAQRDLEEYGVFIEGNRVRIENYSRIPEDVLIAAGLGEPEEPCDAVPAPRVIVPGQLAQVFA